MKSLLPFALLLWSASFLCGGITQPSPAFAEEPAPNESAWRFRVAPYGWLTAVDGNVSIRGLEAPVDINIGDTLSTLEMAFMSYFEVGYQRWSLGLDVVYGKNSKSFAAGGRVFDSFRFELTQLLLTPLLAFRIIETPSFYMEILAGARVVSVSTKLTARLAGGGEIVRRRDTSWADPLVGIRGNWWVRRRFAAHMAGVWRDRLPLQRVDQCRRRLSRLGHGLYQRIFRAEYGNAWTGSWSGV